MNCFNVHSSQLSLPHLVKKEDAEVKCEQTSGQIFRHMEASDLYISIAVY